MDEGPWATDRGQLTTNQHYAGRVGVLLPPAVHGGHCGHAPCVMEMTGEIDFPSAPRPLECRLMDRTTQGMAELHLNGKLVGHVRLVGREGGWYFGELEPMEGFSEFAPLFGRWSLLMHADSEGEKLTDAALEELRDAEIELDRLRARVRMVSTGQWRNVRQLNIDGKLVDWKE